MTHSSHRDIASSPGARQPGEGRHPTARVLVFATHPDAVRVVDLLTGPGGFDVHAPGDPGEAIGWLLTNRCDLVLVEPEAAAGRGCDLLRQVRNLAPGTPVAALSGDDGTTARIDCGVTVPTIRRTADDVGLLVAVHRLIDRSRQADSAPVESVLAIGAHPDDVEIGVGGALLAHGAAGHAVTVLTMSRGAEGGDTDQRVAESQLAASILGARLFMEDLQDTRIPSGHPTVGLIERVIAIVQPTTIYTHSRNDTHQDHRAVHEATMVAARSVPRISCYQAPSATVDFRPNRFVPIGDQLDGKLEAIGAFASQAGRTYLQPDMVGSTARYWGRFAHATHAEALEVIRDSSSLAWTTSPSVATSHAGRTSVPAPIRGVVDVAS